MSDCMPAEQAQKIDEIKKYCLNATNMTEDEAYNFAFRCWQLGFSKDNDTKKIADERDRLILTIEGIMLSVDKWLEGNELQLDEINRAITMREKTLRIVEDLIKENKGLKSQVNRLKKYDEERDILLHSRLIENTRIETARAISKRLKELNRVYSINKSDLKEMDFVIDQVLEEIIEKGVKENA